MVRWSQALTGTMKTSAHNLDSPQQRWNEVLKCSWLKLWDFWFTTIIEDERDLAFETTIE